MTRLVPVALLLLLAAPSARAQSPGAHRERVWPVPLRVLGWSPEERSVYVTDGASLHAMRASGRDSLICVAEGTFNDCWRMIDEAAERLTPLVASPPDGPTFPIERAIVRDDTVTLGDRSFRRCLIDARFAENGPLFSVTAFTATDIAMRARYPIPGTADDLVVFAFHGAPGWGEVWTPVIVPRHAGAGVVREVRHWFAP